MNFDFFAKEIYPYILSPEEKQAVYDYSNFSYSPINSRLRSIVLKDSPINGLFKKTYDYKDISEEETKRVTSILTSAICKFDTVGHLTVYRKLSLPPEALSFVLAQIRSGHFYDGAFSSCSLNDYSFMDFLEYNLTMKILVDRTIKCAFIKYLAYDKSEEEFLLDKSVGFDTIKMLEKTDGSHEVVCRARTLNRENK